MASKADKHIILLPKLIRLWQIYGIWASHLQTAYWQLCISSPWLDKSHICKAVRRLSVALLKLPSYWLQICLFHGNICSEFFTSRLTKENLFFGTDWELYTKKERFCYEFQELVHINVRAESLPSCEPPRCAFSWFSWPPICLPPILGVFCSFHSQNSCH